MRSRLARSRVWWALLIVVLATTLTSCGWDTSSLPRNPTIRSFNPLSVFMLTNDEGWAVGTSVAIPGTPDYNALHFHAGMWHPVSIPGDNFFGVVESAPNDVWALSADTIVHFDGTTWSTIVSPNLAGGALAHMNFRAMALVAPGEGWAVGNNGILHLTHGKWVDASQLMVGAEQADGSIYLGLESVSMDLATDGWAVGEYGTMRHYDGQHWVAASGPATTSQVAARPITLWAVQMLFPSEGWCVGGAAFPERSGPGSDGIVLRFSDGAWRTGFRLPGSGTPNIAGSVGYTLNTISMLSAQDGWIAGAKIVATRQQGGDTSGLFPVLSSLMLHYQHGEWAEERVPNIGAIYSLSMDSPDDGWAAGAGGLLYYHEGAWSEVAI